MKVYEALARAFAAEGTRRVFGMMGDGNMHWMQALDDVGVDLVEVRHEGAGLGMADGWARASHTPGVATATCGPGVTQLGTALVTAARAESPLVAFVGESPTADEEYNQRYDQARFAEACETAFVRVLSPETAEDAVRKAFYIARTEFRPVMLSAAMDLQQKAMPEGEEPYVPSTSLITTDPMAPNQAALLRAVEIIAASRKPVIVAGRGAVWADAREAVLRLGERLGALLATSLMAKTWLAGEPYHAGISGFYGTRAAIELFEEADCVIGVGASLNRYTTEQGYIFPNARYVQLDTKPHLLMGGGRVADCYVQGDARLAVEALTQLLGDRGAASPGYRTPEVQAKLANQFADPTPFTIEPGALDPRDVCRALDEVLPATIDLVSGSGASAGFAVMLMNRPRSLYLAGHFFGCIGQMLPAAMGAVSCTGRPAVLLDGDASILMHLAEIETAVRQRLPLLIVVLNDQALGSEYHKMVSTHMRAELATITTPNIGAVAVAFGGRGCLARTVDEVRSAAQEWLASPGPMVIDARISRAVPTIPYRRLHYGKDE